MTAAFIDRVLVVEQGATFKVRFQWKSGDPPTPVDLTGYTARCTFVNAEDGSEIIKLDSLGHGITLDNQGNIDFRIEAADTMAMSFVTGSYQLELVSPGPTVDTIRLFFGKLRFSPETTV